MLRWVTFRRFVPNWLAFTMAVSITAFSAMSASAILFPPGPGEDDFPPLLIVATSMITFLAALFVGLAAAPFRRLFIGPKFPFARRGYVLAALAPLLWFAVPVLGWTQRAFLFGACEIAMAVTGLAFVWLGGMFGAFDEEEWPGRGGQGQRASAAAEQRDPG